MRPVRMKDIAEHLGLSQTTVSHVLTGKHARYRISAETVERVWKLAEKMGYRINGMARAFRAQKSYALSLADAHVERRIATTATVRDVQINRDSAALARFTEN